MKKFISFVLVSFFIFISILSFPATINVKADSVKGEEKKIYINR